MNTSKSRLTTITRGVVYLMGSGVVVICTILLPELAREEAAGKINPPITWPFFLAAWILAVPIFVSLWQMLKLLKYVDQSKAFSIRSVKALQNIQICTIIFNVLFVLGLTILIIVGERAGEDMPPFGILGAVITSVSGVVITSIAILKRLLKDAISIKSENDQIV